MSNFQGLYHIRDYKESDKSFVLATFLRGLYHGDSWFSQIPRDVFMNSYKIIAESMIVSPKNIIQIACLKEDSDVILGYSILSADFKAIRWVYVKSVWRKQGIGRSLVPQFPSTVTHLTILGKSLMDKIPTAIFNPFI